MKRFLLAVLLLSSIYVGCGEDESPTTGVVYVITNNITGEKYVGQTTKPVMDRWEQHQQDALNNSTASIHKSMRRYGIQNFDIEIVQPVRGTLEDRLQAERDWMDKTDSYINGLNQRR